MAATFAVIDFETTGLSPAQGDRATEIAAVILENGRVVDRFASLMNPGRRIPAYVQALTGITDQMVATAPAPMTVMKECLKFVGRRHLVAHNAAFDRRFWQAETAKLRGVVSEEFICTMLLSRRIYPNAPNHRLGGLQEHLRIPSAGRAHRALADAEVACELLLRIDRDLQRTYNVSMTGEILGMIQKAPAASVAMRIRALVR